MIEQQWHIDKTISVGHLMSTVLIAITLIGWGNSIDKRVEHNNQAAKFIVNRINIAEEETARLRLDTNETIRSMRSEIKTDLRDINLKLDRIIEKK